MNTDLTWQTTCENSDQTEKLGLILGKTLHPPFIIELIADVGGGKTTFIKGMAKGLGVKEKISSPSFSITKEYSATNNYKLFHFDIYRLDKPGIITNQISEIAANKLAIIAVEWPQKITGVLPKNRISLEIFFDPYKQDTRHIKIIFPTKYKNLLSEIERLWEK